MAPRKSKPARKTSSRKRPSKKSAIKAKAKAAAAKRTAKPVSPLRPRKSLAHRKGVAAPRRGTRAPAKSGHVYDRDLEKNPANFQPLSPLTFLERAAKVFPDHPAIVHGSRTTSYAEFY